jgi:DNA-binding Lrp family transcriptional regulator
MIEKLDYKDKLLLHSLDSNARLSYSQLAKKTRLSQETVRYRINNLSKKGIIKKYLTLINLSKLGFSVYEVMLKLQNMNEQKKKTIIDYLIKNPFVNWVANLEGNYDIAFIFSVKNQMELNNLMNELHKLFGNTIIKKDLSVLISSQFLSRDYLINKPRKTINEPAYSPTQKTLELEDKDKILCSELSKDGGTSYVDLSKEMHISADAVVNRLKKLKDNLVIGGSTIILDNNKIGQLHYKLLLFINDFTESNVNGLINTIKQNNRVIAIVKTLAQWDYEVDLEVENVDQLKEFTMELTSKFSQLIRDYIIIRVIDMPKYSLYN